MEGGERLIQKRFPADITLKEITFLNDKKIDAELFNKAIRGYFYSKEKNTLKLYEYAKKMNIYDKVRNTFEVLQ